MSKQATCGMCGRGGGDRLDRREIVRLVQRRQRHQLGERGHDVGIDPHRRGEFSAAVDDAMAEGQHRPAAQQLAAELQDLGRGAAMIELARAPASLGDDRRPSASATASVGGDADVLDLPAKQQRAVAARLVERELDARRAGIEDGDAVRSWRAASQATMLAPPST